MITPSSPSRVNLLSNRIILIPQIFILLLFLFAFSPTTSVEASYVAAMSSKLDVDPNTGQLRPLSALPSRPAALVCSPTFPYFTIQMLQTTF